MKTKKQEFEIEERVKYTKTFSGRWFYVDYKKPKADTDVLITYNGRYGGKGICIGMFYPKGYEVDYCPVYSDCRSGDEDWFKYDEEKEVYIFTKDKWLESYGNYDEIAGYWLEDEQVVAWATLPKLFDRKKQKIMIDLNKTKERVRGTHE